jgi:predicted nucleic acid-binding protein
MVDGKARLLQEPLSLDGTFRRHSSSDSVSPHQWADAYLAAFADQYGMSLVTFDKAHAARAVNPILLS